ncbi:MAG: peroxiredoxin family protein [Armatimonadota bacterium]
MQDRNKSLKLIIVMIALLLVLSFGIQYANHPPVPKVVETKESHAEEEHAKLVGMPPMDFTMASVAEGPITLSQFKDKKHVVMIFTIRQNTNFSKILNTFAALDKEYGQKNVKPIIICMSEPIAKIREFATKNGVKTTLLADVNGSVGMQYMQAAMAGCFIISKSGLIYATNTNTNPDTLLDDLKMNIDDMLNGIPPVQVSPHGPGEPEADPHAGHGH